MTKSLTLDEAAAVRADTEQKLRALAVEVRAALNAANDAGLPATFYSDGMKHADALATTVMNSIPQA